MFYSETNEFFSDTYEILLNRDLKLLEILLYKTNEFLKNYNRDLIKEYIITYYNLIISYIIRSDIGIEFFNIRKHILEDEKTLLYYLLKFIPFLQVDEKDDNFFNNAGLFFYLFEKFVDIDLKRNSFIKDNTNAGRSILNTLEITEINKNIEESKKVINDLKRSLNVKNV